MKVAEDNVRHEHCSRRFLYPVPKMVPALDGLATGPDVGIPKVVPYHRRLVDCPLAVAEVGLLVRAEMLPETFTRKVHRPGVKMSTTEFEQNEKRTRNNFSARPGLPGR